MDHGICELLWIRSALKDLGFRYEKPMSLHYDNKTSIEIA
jgi:hypothetical protein